MRRSDRAVGVVAADRRLRYFSIPMVRAAVTKKLTALQRCDIFAALSDPDTACAVVAVGEASVEEIDSINILQASLLAMQRAAAALAAALGAQRVPHMALVDGNQLPRLSCQARAVVRGDSLSLSIAAASVIAKVTRDRLMVGMHDDWPAYDFRTHKGYITSEHEAALAEHGPSPVHRMRFVNVRRAAGLEPMPGPALEAATSLGQDQPAPGGDTVEEDA